MELLHSLEVDNVNTSNISENTCRADFDLIVDQMRSIGAATQRSTGLIEDGKVIFRQSVNLVLYEGNWLLALTSDILKRFYEQNAKDIN